MKPKSKRKIEQKSDCLTLTKDLAALKIRSARDHLGQVIESFTVRETDGNDETLAAQAAAQRKDNSVSPQEELIKLSVVAVNGVEVEQPFDAWDRWNSKARNLTVIAYRQLNGTSPEETEAFLKQGEIEGNIESLGDSPSGDEQETA